MEAVRRMYRQGGGGGRSWSEADRRPTTTRPVRRLGVTQASVSVLAAIDLEDPADQGDRAEADADDEEPPAEDDPQHDDAERQRAPQRPPGVRREEAQLTG